MRDLSAIEIRSVLKRMMKVETFNELFWMTLHYSVRLLAVPLRVSRRRDMIHAFERHEPRVTHFLSQMSGDIFLDIGANLGHYTELASHCFRIVYALEPEPANFKFLTDLVREKALTNVTVQRIAIADFNGSANLRDSNYPKDPTQGWTLETEYNYTNYGIGTTRICTFPIGTVAVRTLASLFPKRSISVVKVDVEGSEWKVLKGAQPIMDRIRAWVIELHDMTKKRELEAYMEKFGYSHRWLDENHCFFRMNA
jgi:FkbM family methyltransferase